MLSFKNKFKWKKYICTFFWEKVLENYINSDDVHYLGTTQDREMLFS